MASLTETTVKVEVLLTRDGDGNHAIARATSFDANGVQIRRITTDIIGQLSAARQSGINDLLNDIETKVKTLWQIP